MGLEGEVRARADVMIGHLARSIDLEKDDGAQAFDVEDGREREDDELADLPF